MDQQNLKATYKLDGVEYPDYTDIPDQGKAGLARGTYDHVARTLISLACGCATPSALIVIEMWTLKSGVVTPIVVDACCVRMRDEAQERIDASAPTAE
jgi:hypothetical protein